MELEICTQWKYGYLNQNFVFYFVSGGAGLLKGCVMVVFVYLLV